MAARTAGAPELSESEVFHVLGNDRRRAILHLLDAESDPLEVSAVASAIADREAAPGSSSNDRYKSVYVSLQQTHLPQLAENGIVVYDQSAKTVGRGPNFEQVRRYVDSGSRSTELALMFALAAAILGLALVAGGVALPVVAAVDPLLWSVGCLLSIAVVCLLAILR